MEVNPEAREFSEIFELPANEEEREKEQALVERLAKEGKLIAKGPKEELLRLQDDLRQVGYRQQFKEG